MIPAFWDASALVPLCVQQGPSAGVRQRLRQHEIAVWWATPVEMRSAFERLLRTGALSSAEHALAGVRLDELRQHWKELQPTETLRTHAENFLKTYSLKAADALQLAAAWMWCSGEAKNSTFISDDAHLIGAARRIGFSVVAA